MVWGIFSAQGVSSLFKINQNMNAAIYKNFLENNLLYTEEPMPKNRRF